MRPPIVAVDGPAASGKGTLARRLAEVLGVSYLDTGLLYRAVARRVLNECGSGAAGPSGSGAEPWPSVASVLTLADTTRDDLRTPDVDAMASKVAADPGVRAALLERQRDFARDRGAVLDGRDIGTVIFPDADAKLFVTATAAERARRRLLQRGETPTPDTLAAETAALEARDQADAERAAAPLRQAEDADRLDTTHLDPDAAFQAALALVKARLARRTGKDHFDP